jgi:hypothetical protein
MKEVWRVWNGLCRRGGWSAEEAESAEVQDLGHFLSAEAGPPRRGGPVSASDLGLGATQVDGARAGAYNKNV